MKNFSLLCVFLAFSNGSALMQLKMSSITNGAIIGGGRIGNQLFEGNGKKDTFLSGRTDTLPAGGSGPIYVCTRNNDLEAIIENTPADRKDDLIFLQNGYFEEYLKSKGLQDNTQALVYYAVSKKGEEPIDGDNLTCATGKWAADFQARLQSTGLTCRVVDKESYKISMFEKHIWICAFMAIGATHKCTVGEVVSAHNAEVRALIEELASATAHKEKIVFSDGLGDRLCDYAQSVAHFPTALKEFEWRNGWFGEVSMRAMMNLQNDPCPLHTDILRQQSLIFQTRKSFIAKTRKAAQIVRERDAYRRELDEYKMYTRGADNTPKARPPRGAYQFSPSVNLFKERLSDDEQRSAGLLAPEEPEESSE